MKEYGKIKTDGSIQPQGNPVSVTVSNPTDDQRGLLAELRGELEMVRTPEPEYDPEKQYLTEAWVEQDGKAVQVWTVHEKTVEDAADETLE